MRHAVLIAILAGLGTTSAAYADVYRWVDAEGRVQYSDRWVPGSVLVKTDRARPNPETTAARRSAEQNRVSIVGQRVAEQQARQNAAQAVREDVARTQDQQCKEAKERYDKSIQARRIFRTGKSGEREYLSDAEADEYRLQARSAMDSACGPAAR